jgi:hypothetical protein
MDFNEIYSIAFTYGRTLTLDGLTVSFSTATAGLVSLPSGRVVACDPLTAIRPAQFVQTVLPGRYAVELALARSGSGPESVAMARIKFTNRQPAVWVLALRKGEDPAELAPGATFGYRSESGTGSFMDGETVAQADFAHLEDIDSLLFQLTGNYKPHRYWLEQPVDRRHNVVMFSSGEGAGTYPSYFGIDEEGDICTLVTDFLLF